MKPSNFYTGIDILRKYEMDFSIDYVAKSFPNGTPDNPSICYVCFEFVEDEAVTEEEANILISLGWRPEQEGLCWLFEH